VRVTGREGFVRRQRLIVSAPEFFDTYAPRFFRFVMRRASDQDLAEEITQTTLIAAAGKLKTWRAGPDDRAALAVLTVLRPGRSFARRFDRCCETDVHHQEDSARSNRLPARSAALAEQRAMRSSVYGLSLCFWSHSNVTRKTSSSRPRN